MSKNAGKFVFDPVPPQTNQISQNITVSTVTNRQQFWDFFRVPWRVYEDDEFWVPSLWENVRDFFMKNNPFWDHSESRLFVVYEDGKAVGRIAAFVDNNLPKINGKKIGYFGYFECICDPSIASALFEAAQDFLASKKRDTMHGPVNGRIDLGSGFLAKGFGSMPYLLGSYSPNYYLDFAEKFGMKKSRDLVSYNIDLSKPIPSSVKKASEDCKEKGINIRPFDRSNFEKEIDIWFDLLLDVFVDHYGYTPSSNEEMRVTFGIKELKWVMNPKLFLFAEIDDKPIGFRWSVPDFNPVIKTLNGKLGTIGKLKFLSRIKSIERGRFIIMGIKKKYQGQGIGTGMNYYTLLEMKKQGYTSAEYGWIDENNIASRKSGEKMGGTLSKIYRIYEKDL